MFYCWHLRNSSGAVLFKNNIRKRGRFTSTSQIKELILELENKEDVKVLKSVLFYRRIGNLIAFIFIVLPMLLTIFAILIGEF